MPYRLTVLGTGYLGTTHAACMADLGHEVVGLDVDPERVATLSAGRVPFHEPGLEELLRKGLERRRLRFTTSYDEAADFGDVHFLCVGTPQREGSYAADLSQMDDCVTSLAPRLTRECVVVGKSTVPAGTAQRLAAEIARLAPAGEEVDLAWNPEFLREGKAVSDTLRPGRIVAGVHSARAETTLREVYAPLIDAGVPFLVTDYATAELVKSAANAFLATKVSFINAVAEVCEAAGADVIKLAAALAYDDRIGRRYLHAGVGYGGGCLPKDMRAFIARGRELGAGEAVALLEEVDAINQRRRIRVTDLARDLVGGFFSGRRVAMLGAAFKPHSDDVRDSPALDIAAHIQAEGASVAIYDPVAGANAKRTNPAFEYVESMDDVVRGAHVTIHLTEWPEFRDADPGRLGKLTAERAIVDGRNVLDAECWRAAGWRFRAPGRP
ncbi:MAG: UDP-glucose dehydrogenase family protein [Streptosporangiaceae bacterium]